MFWQCFQQDLTNVRLVCRSSMMWRSSTCLHQPIQDDASDVLASDHKQKIKIEIEIKQFSLQEKTHSVSWELKKKIPQKNERKISKMFHCYSVFSFHIQLYWRLLLRIGHCLFRNNVFVLRYAKTSRNNRIVGFYSPSLLLLLLFLLSIAWHFDHLPIFVKWKLRCKRPCFTQFLSDSFSLPSLSIEIMRQNQLQLMGQNSKITKP